MIALFIILATIATFVTWMLISQPLLRYSLGMLSLVILGSSIYFLTNHFVNHSGMRIETTQASKLIYSVGDVNAPYGFIIYKEVGSKSDQHVLIYRSKKNQSEAMAHFIPNQKHIMSAIKKKATYQMANVDEASLTTVTKRYVWKSDWAKLLYGFGREDGQLLSQKSVLTLPEKTWLALTESEAKQLEKLIRQMQADLKAHPEKAKEAQMLAQKNPKAFAEKQVSELKKALTKEN